MLIFVRHIKLVEIADATLGIATVVVLSVTFYPTMKQSGLILLQTVPKHIDVECLKKAILDEFPVILSIHDLHIWCLTSEKVIATCHVSLPPHSTASYAILAKKLENFMAKHGISLVTMQPEFEPQDSPSSGRRCLYKCSNTKGDCIEKKCCHEKDDEDCQNVAVQVG